MLYVTDIKQKLPKKISPYLLVNALGCFNAMGQASQKWLTYGCVHNLI